MLQPQVHFYKKRVYTRIVEQIQAVGAYVQTSLGLQQGQAQRQEQQAEQDSDITQNVILPPPPTPLNLGTTHTSCPTYGYVGETTESVSPYVPPPPLNLRSFKVPSYGGLEEPPTPRLSIGIPFSNLDTHTHNDPTPDYANSPLSQTALEEIRHARVDEANARTEAIAQAYIGFVREDTPLHHLTPHSQRTPASYLSHMSSPPSMSPLALSPTATPKASVCVGTPTPKAPFPLLPTIMSDSALNTLV